MVAEPRVIKEDDPAGEELVSIKTFKDLFMCPICFNLLKNPEAVRYCMHKFCRDCVTELSKSTRQCPQCRVQLGSRRIWRADTLTQQIIDKLVDNMDEFNQHEVDARNAELKKSFDFSGFSKTMKEGLQKQRKVAVEEDKKGFTPFVGALTLEQRRSLDVRHPAARDDVSPLPVPVRMKAGQSQSSALNKEKASSISRSSSLQPEATPVNAMKRSSTAHDGKRSDLADSNRGSKEETKKNQADVPAVLKVKSPTKLSFKMPIRKQPSIKSDKPEKIERKIMKHPTMKMKNKVVAKKQSYRPPIVKRQEKVEEKK